MSARALFKEADLTRALRASRKAGVPVRVEIEVDRMIILPVDATAIGPAKSLDEMFA